MSNWIRVTIAVTQENKQYANALARIVGFSVYDEQTFGALNYENEEGVKFCVASTLAKEAFVQDVSSPLVLPAWGGNLADAEYAQSILSVYQEGNPIPFANADYICAVIHDDVQVALDILGLTPVHIPIT